MAAAPCIHEDLKAAARRVRQDSFEAVANSIRVHIGAGLLISWDSALAAHVRYLRSDGVSFRRLSVECAVFGVKRYPMWFCRTFGGRLRE